MARVTLRGLHVSSAADVASENWPSLQRAAVEHRPCWKTLKKDCTTFTRLLNKMSPG